MLALMGTSRRAIARSNWRAKNAAFVRSDFAIICEEGSEGVLAAIASKGRLARLPIGAVYMSETIVPGIEVISALLDSKPVFYRNRFLEEPLR